MLFDLVVPKGISWKIDLHFYRNFIKNFLEPFIISYLRNPNTSPDTLFSEYFFYQRNMYLCNQAGLFP